MSDKTGEDGCLDRQGKPQADSADRGMEFTVSGLPVDVVYTRNHVAGADWEDQGLPGQYPYVRGIHATGYRGRLWTTRMFAGYGSAEETNKRFKYLIKHGETGLSVAFDMPTLMGYDCDDPTARGEFGKCGVAISSVADMDVLFKGIPLDQVSTSMTINGPAAVIWAMYIVAAENRGIPAAKLAGTIQNDILKEYIAQNEFIFPPGPSMRLVVDTFEFGSRHLPRWNTISVSGYHIREAGATAVQELAFTLADGLAYVQAGVERGLEVDDFAPRISFFFNAHNEFFEEIAKFRAARRIWAQEMRRRYNPGNERSLRLRFHTQTAGCTLTAQQPQNNAIRIAFQALAAVLGGAQSLHTNSLDEALALPSDEAVLLALRTQQIIACESGVTKTVDPLGGSFMIEALTRDMEKACYNYFEKIEAQGGVIPALEKGFFQNEIALAAYRYQQQIEKKERIVVGVNKYVTDETPAIPLLKMDRAGYQRHLERLNQVRTRRDSSDVARKLDSLRHAARGEANLMPYIIEAVRADATLGDICKVFREEFGEYKAHSVL